MRLRLLVLESDGAEPWRWSWPHVYDESPRAIELMGYVFIWQVRHGVRTDGLIGWETWTLRDGDLAQVARELYDELVRAKLAGAWQGMFLRVHARIADVPAKDGSGRGAGVN